MGEKGFTLVELLAIIVILSIIMVIAVPNVLGIIDNARNNSFLATAKRIVLSVKTKTATNINLIPTTNLTAKVITFDSLELDNVGKDVDGGNYGANSYVYIVKDDAGLLYYYVTLQGSRRAINKVEENKILTATIKEVDEAEEVVIEGEVILEGIVYTVQ